MPFPSEVFWFLVGIKKKIIAKTIAPDIKRIIVKPEASMLPFFRARRQSTELPAKAIKAKAVIMHVLIVVLIETYI